MDEASARSADCVVLSMTASRDHVVRLKAAVEFVATAKQGWGEQAVKRDWKRGDKVIPATR
jgi:hypothetical protein